MTDPETRIAELEARNAALQARNHVLTETALISSANHLRGAAQMHYLLKMVERYGIPFDWEYFNGLGAEELGGEELASPTVPPRRAEIQLIN